MSLIPQLFGTSFLSRDDDDVAVTVDEPVTVSVDDLYALGESGYASPPERYGTWGGDKFFDGFGATEIDVTDYWTLRQRSAQLFKKNLYARGIIRRLLTNEINTGLSLESCPEEGILGFEEGTLEEWSEEVEDRFHIWEKSPRLCDAHNQRTWGQLQHVARQESLVVGDILRVTRIDPSTGLPRVQLISGWLVSTPFGHDGVRNNGNRIIHGVELDSMDRQVAYWIAQHDGSHKRLPAYGPRTGRRIARLIYGTDRRMDDVRGEPLLALLLQSIREIDRYRDSTLRKAVVNSLLAIFIKKTSDKMGSKPLGAGAVRRDQTTVDDGGRGPRRYDIAQQHPGLTLETLAEGEEPVGFHNQGVDEKFGEFEEAIVQAMAWALEIPPETLRLSFSSNYSASQAATNEFKIYLNKFRTHFGEDFCQDVFVEWLLSQAMRGGVRATGLLDTFRNPSRMEEFLAWTMADWSGAIKLSTDILKQAKGYEKMRDNAWITNERSSRELTGQKFTRNVRKLRRENELLVEAATPLAEFEKKYGKRPTDFSEGGMGAEELAETVADAVADRQEESNG